MNPYRVALITASLATASALVVAACAHKGDGAGATVMATLARSQCFGTCPIYEVKVHADGTVVYEGKDFVKVKGRHTAKLPPGKQAELEQAFQKARYFEMRDAYDDEQVVDNAWATTSFSKGGKTKTIQHYLSDESAPGALAELEERIDAILETSRWVGTREERDVLDREWMK